MAEVFFNWTSSTEWPRFVRLNAIEAVVKVGQGAEIYCTGGLMIPIDDEPLARLLELIRRTYRIEPEASDSDRPPVRRL